MNMKKKYNPLQRILAVALSMVMVFSLLPAIQAGAADTQSATKVDAPTMDSWEMFFDPSNVSTAHAGGIWTDKSVFNTSAAFSQLGINLSNQNNFLVALSALAANSVVVGQGSTPTDTMFVLDISGSMSSSEINAMITAANDAIRTLMGINIDNRVGIVLYSDEASVLLALDRYVGVADGNNVEQYIQRGAEITINTIFGPYTYTSDSYISTVEGLENGAGTAVSEAVALEGGTYIQGGLWAAWEEFNALTDATSIARTPVMVLMSDGAPTMVTNDYSAVPDVYEYGEGNGSLDGDGFVTQLTAAYVKAQMAAKYGTIPYLYTLGLGVDNVTDSDVAIAVLDTSADRQIDGIDDYWTTYESLANSQSKTMRVTLGSRNSNNGTSQNVTYDASIAGKRDYVDRYFPASDASALNTAFRGIVNEISLQSGYYPTRLDDDAPNYGGYITFVDEIGMGMEVKEIEGIVIGDQLYSGLHLAEAIRDGGFGSREEPTTLGDNMVWAVKERLEIADTEVARDLLANAFQNQQLYYGEDGSWSNYIGWYGNAAGDFLAAWPNDNGQPADAVYINRSYGMLGSTTNAQTALASDMMYVVIQVSTNIQTGHQIVTFRIPAALLPVVTYEITINDGADPDASEDIELEYRATNPMRLVYEVGLRSDVTPWNIAEILPEGYKANDDGTYNLYTNHWYSASTGNLGTPTTEELEDLSKNHFTYAYFEPSEENEHYYFTENSPVLDGNHNPVTEIVEGQTYYFAHRTFQKTGDNVEVIYLYEELSETALNSAVADENGDFYVPEGVMHRNTHSHDLSKDPNETSTLSWIRKQVVDAKVNGDQTHHYEVVYMGNNGVLNYQPGQGIKLSKEMAEGETSEDAFTFTVKLTPNNSTVEDTYETILINADGTQVSGQVTVADNSFEVSLYAGQSVYILGIDGGVGYTITENDSAGYRVDQVNGAAGSTATGTVSDYEFSAVTFTNTIQHYSSINIVKSVEYRNGTAAPAVATESFPVEVTLTLDGQPYAGKTVGVDGVNKTTDASGKLSLTILDGQQITITNLPVGAVFTVAEGELNAGYKWENPNDASLNGTVTLAESTAILLNSYTPEEVELTQEDADVLVTVDKTLQHANLSVITDWATDNFSFQFELSRWDGSDWDGIDTVTMTTPTQLQLDMAGQNFETVDSYYFRVSETVGTRSGMTYDRTLHIFEVVVTDTTLDGALEISDVRPVQHANVTKAQDADIWTVSTAFTNTYEPASTKLAFTAHKKLTGRDLVANEFTFELYETDSSFATDGVTPKTTTNGLKGDIIFDPITYTVADEYYYVLKEVIGADDLGIDYDETVYNIKVTVSNVSDQLKVTEIQVNGNEVEDLSEELVFENEYSAEMKTPVVLEGTKTLNGRDIKDGDNFRFTLESEDGSYSETVGCGLDGKFSFTGLSFEAAGVYTYYISEEEGTLGGVTYDERVHTVVITVTDNGLGELIASYTVDGANNGPIHFVNVYESVMKTPVVIEGSKTLTGRDMAEGEFSFELWRANEYGVEGKAPRLTAVNDGNEGFAFSEIYYPVAGEWEYVLVETKGNLGGITYDDTVYEILVTVTDNGEGELIGSYTVDGEPDTIAAFENTYEAKPTKLALSGTKILTGRTLLEGEFSFTLEAVNDEPMPTTATVANGVDGKIIFGEVEYTAVGEYFYTIREVQDGIPGITYDPAVYEVTVTVIDDGMGNLVASVKALHTGTQIEVPVIEFFNRYRANSVDVTLKGTKTLEGRDLEDGEFSFILLDEAGEPVETVTNTDGAFQFTALTFDAPGTYVYSIVEDDSDPLENVEYDDTVYTVTIEVTDNLEGYLVATVNGEAPDAFSADFVNIYAERPPQTGDWNGWIPVLSVVALAAIMLLAVVNINKEKSAED